MEQVKPALEAAGAKYLSRGGAHKIYEGDWVGKPLFCIDLVTASPSVRPEERHGLLVVGCGLSGTCETG